MNIHLSPDTCTALYHALRDDTHVEVTVLYGVVQFTGNNCVVQVTDAVDHFDEGTFYIRNPFTNNYPIEWSEAVDLTLDVSYQVAHVSHYLMDIVPKPLSPLTDMGQVIGSVEHSQARALAQLASYGQPWMYCISDHGPYDASWAIANKAISAILHYHLAGTPVLYLGGGLKYLDFGRVHFTTTGAWSVGAVTCIGSSTVPEVEDYSRVGAGMDDVYGTADYYPRRHVLPERGTTTGSAIGLQDNVEVPNAVVAAAEVLMGNHQVGLWSGTLRVPGGPRVVKMVGRGGSHDATGAAHPVVVITPAQGTWPDTPHIPI